MTFIWVSGFRNQFIFSYILFFSQLFEKLSVKINIQNLAGKIRDFPRNFLKLYYTIICENFRKYSNWISTQLIRFLYKKLTRGSASQKIYKKTYQLSIFFIFVTNLWSPKFIEFRNVIELSSLKSVRIN